MKKNIVSRTNSNNSENSCPPCHLLNKNGSSSYHLSVPALPYVEVLLPFESPANYSIMIVIFQKLKY